MIYVNGHELEDWKRYNVNMAVKALLCFTCLQPSKFATDI